MEEKDKISIDEKLIHLAHMLEVVISVFLILAVMVGFIDLIKQIVEFMQADLEFSYDIFKHFLSFVLLLVVGLEFVSLLMTHSITKTVEIVIFIITRKLLIYGSSMLDMLLGALSIAVIFAILKFLIPGEPIFKREKNN